MTAIEIPQPVSGLRARNIDDKRRNVDELKSMCEDSQSVILMNYSKVKASEMQVLRQQARNEKVSVVVCKNTVAKIAFQESKYKNVLDGFSGQIVLFFSMSEPNKGAKLLEKSMKENPNIEVKCLCLGGKMLPASQLKVVAALPTKDEAIAMLMSVMNAPTTRLVGTLADVIGRFARTLNQVAEKKVS